MYTCTDARCEEIFNSFVTNKILNRNIEKVILFVINGAMEFFFSVGNKFRTSEKRQMIFETLKAILQFIRTP